MRKPFIVPLWYYVSIVPLCVPLFMTAGGAYAIAALLRSQTPFALTILPLALYGPGLLAAGLRELRIALAFRRDLVRHPKERWRALFPRSDATQTYVMKQSDDVVDILRMGLVYGLSCLVVLWAIVVDFVRRQSDVNLVFTAVLVMTVGLCLFLGIRERRDAKHGRARLFLPQTPIFLGGECAGSIVVPGADIVGKEHSISLILRDEKTKVYSWRGTVDSIGKENANGVPALTFSFVLPAIGGGLFDPTVSWFIVAKQRGSGVPFTCQFANLPVFNQQPTLRTE